ncbi:hypothetical protein DXG01_002741, partial [Tephrocybe rancida]
PSSPWRRTAPRVFGFGIIDDEVKSVKKEDAKPYTKAPKIQRLVTPLRLQRRRHLHSLKRRRLEHQKEQKLEFDALLAKRVAEKKAKVRPPTRLPRRVCASRYYGFCATSVMFTVLPTYTGVPTPLRLPTSPRNTSFLFTRVARICH